MRLYCFGIVSFTLLAWGFEARGEDWPMWRGPRGDGIGKGADVPTTWSDTENIRWKSSIPGDGRSSPIVCKDSVFVTTSLPDTLSRRLIRLNRDSGAIVWDVEVHYEVLAKNRLDEMVQASPAISDGAIYVRGERHVWKIGSETKH